MRWGEGERVIVAGSWVVPAYTGYMTANAIAGFTRAWLMGQGHCVAAIDSVNLLLGNMTPAHAERYRVTDEGLTRYVRDFYSYRLKSDGTQDSPLGSHVNANTAGGLAEGGYLGFAELQYFHMPLPGERLVTFLSDGAFEEQRGGDWAPRWWRAEDCGLVTPIMINNGRRIDQRTTMSQQGGVSWFERHLRLNGFDPIVFDGRDPAAFVWAIFEMENRLQLEAFKFRVTDPEPGVPEAVDGAVITALNEEAVVSAALANKGGINITVIYEAFGAKMHGAVRQEVIFANHFNAAGRRQGWLSVPLVLTSHTWENGKNEQSHQDPVMAEAMMAEPSDVARVLFPADYNTAAVVMQEVYQSHGQVWTLVVPKANVPDLFTPDEAARLFRDGAIRLDWSSYKPERAHVILTAVGSYQLAEVLKASARLAEREIEHIVVYMLEPGRFRSPRSEGEQAHRTPLDVHSTLYPNKIEARIFLTHTRPEALLGTLQPLHTGSGTVGLGYVNHGGTLNVKGMLFVNRSTWAHCLAEVARLLDLARDRLLVEDEIAALDRRTSPEGIII